MRLLRHPIRLACLTCVTLLAAASSVDAQPAAGLPMSPDSIFKKSVGIYYPGSNGDAPMSPDDQAFNVFKVADGVYHAIGVNGVFANSTFMVNSDHVVVVDAQLRPSWAKLMIAEIRKVTPKPVKYLIYTHWHIDHVGGAQAYVDAFPGVQIIGQSYLLKDLGIIGGTRKDEFLSNGSARAKAAIEKLIADGKDQKGNPLDARGKAELERMAAQERTYLAENAQMRNVPPTITYDRQMVLRDSVRDIELHYLGIAHTRGDTFVFLPKEKMVITGDAFGSGLPGGHDGYPIEWQSALQGLYRLDWNLVLPAHGRPLQGKTQLVRAIDYLNDMNLAVKEAVAKGMTLQQTQAAVTLPRHAADFPGIDFATANAPIVARAWAILTHQPKSINGEPIITD